MATAFVKLSGGLDPVGRNTTHSMSVFWGKKGGSKKSGKKKQDGLLFKTQSLPWALRPSASGRLAPVAPAARKGRWKGPQAFEAEAGGWSKEHVACNLVEVSVSKNFKHTRLRFLLFLLFFFSSFFIFFFIGLSCRVLVSFLGLHGGFGALLWMIWMCCLGGFSLWQS